MFSAGTEARAGLGWRTVCERERRGAEEVDVQVAGLAEPAHAQQTCQYHRLDLQIEARNS